MSSATSGAGRSIVAIIPARGGSKGIPRKNLVDLCGRPLLAYTIEDALLAPEVSEVFVSTDSGEIAAFAESAGASVIHRPAELATDTAASESALLHALDAIRDRDGRDPDLIVFLQATSPLRPPNGVSDAIRTLLREDADSLFSACRSHGFVWRRAAERLQSVSYDYKQRPRRQDIGEDLIENGSIYVFKPELLRGTGNRLGGRIAVFEMDPLDSLQVDEPPDLQRLERILNAVPRAARQGLDLKKIRLLALDFDGVFTDNRVIVFQDGSEAVVCNRGDGLGLERLREAGVSVVVLSKEKNPVVAARCDKLGIQCFQGLNDKLSALKSIAEERAMESGCVAYVGNDVNDVDCLRWAGVPIAVADAVPQARRAAAWITRSCGGLGAIREICDAILE